MLEKCKKCKDCNCKDESPDKKKITVLEDTPLLTEIMEDETNGDNDLKILHEGK